MKLEEGYFSSFDGTEIFYRTYIHPSPKGSVLLIHGYGDHSGRYNDLAQKLSSLSLSYFAFDLRGQGKSKGQRVDAQSFNDYVKDVSSYVEFLRNKKQISLEKIFLIGHSMGGLIARKVLKENEKIWKAVVFSSPCFELYGISWSRIARFLTKKLNQFTPNFVMSNLVKPRFLFHDQAKLKEYLKDPLIEKRVTCRLAQLIVEECLEAQREKPQFQVPICILASGDDHVVSLEATKSWFNRVQAPQKSIKIYPALYHEIFNETNTEEPVQDLVKFLTACL